MSTADNCFPFTERGNALLHVTYVVSAERANVTNGTRAMDVLNREYAYVPNVMSQKWQSTKWMLLWVFLFFLISCGRNVLLHGKFMEVKIWCTLVEVLAKNKLVRYAHSCVF